MYDVGMRGIALGFQAGWVFDFFHTTAAFWGLIQGLHAISRFWSELCRVFIFYEHHLIYDVGMRGIALGFQAGWVFDFFHTTAAFWGLIQGLHAISRFWSELCMVFIKPNCVRFSEKTAFSLRRIALGFPKRRLQHCFSSFSKAWNRMSSLDQLPKSCSSMEHVTNWPSPTAQKT